MSAAVAQGQTAGQITPRSFEPPEPRVGAPIQLPQDQLRIAPEGAAALSIMLGGVEAIGGTLMPDTLAMLRSRLVGRQVSVADIYAAAGEAEAAEARGGRVLVRIVVPQQDLRDGVVLRLTVISGFIERIDDSALPRPVRRRIARVVAGLSDDPAITLAQIERSLLLAADAPGVTLRSTLIPGARPGGVVLRLDADYHPIAAFVSIDNTLPDALGRTVAGIGLDLNGLAGLGEQVYLRASGLPRLGGSTGFFHDTPRNRALAAGAILPIGSDGLALRIEGVDARTTPRPASALSPSIGSVFRRLTTELRYAVVRRRDLTLNVSAGLDVQDERVDIVGPLALPISRDRLRIVRLAGDILAFLPSRAVVTGRLEPSFGIDGLGARSAADATPLLPLSRAGSDASFAKLAAAAGLTQPLGTQLAFDLRGRAQTSFGKAMANAEQIGIATVDALSPLPSGLVQGDEGYAVRGELRATLPLATTPVFASLAPYSFVAQGVVHFIQPTAVERPTTHALAYGAGIRFAGAGSGGRPGLTASVEYGRAHLEGLRPDRVTFTVLARF